MRTSSSENRSFDQPRIGSERSFGILFAALFAVIGLLPLASGTAARIWLLPLAVLFLVSAIVAPWLLRPLNWVWFRFGLLLGRIVTPIVMGLLFYLIITPVAILMRSLGKDPLGLKSDVTISTYWRARMPPGPESDSLRKQY